MPVQAAFARPVYVESIVERDDGTFIPKNSLYNKLQGCGTFFFNALGLSYSYHLAKNEQAVIIGIAGLNSHEVLEAHEIEKLNKRGISYIIIELGALYAGSPSIYNRLDVVEQFCLSQHSPIHKLVKPESPLHLGGHSTGTAIALDIFEDPRAKKFSSLTLIALYLDSAYVSRLPASNPIKNELKKLARLAYESYTNACKDQRVGDTRVGKLYLAYSNRAGMTNSPTFGQVREVETYVGTVRDQFNPESLANTPTNIILGDKDTLICLNTAKDFAGQVAVEPTIVKGGDHYPMTPQLLDTLTDRMLDHAAKKAEQKTQMSYVTPALRLEISPGELPEPLGYRFSLALQSRTRLLDASAGFLKSLFGSRVGNAEVRGQTEGDALHASHAFRFQ